MEIYEKLGEFFLGKHYDLEKKEEQQSSLLYDSKDLTTHAVCVGMTGSGKTGLCVTLLEEAILDSIPAIIIDPKGDLGNLLLTFPNLTAQDFRPWINEDDAKRKGISPEEYSAQQAQMWQKGLASYGQSPQRIAALRDSADFIIYTPGSEAGVPVSILSSFSAPSQGVINEPDLLRDRVSTTATSLLGLLGINADPIQSREHILISTILHKLWKEGNQVDLGKIIQAIQNPPVKKIGFMDIESFFPSKDRFKFAMQVNNLLAAPGFQGWLTGQPLEIDQILHTAEGKPRIAIFSISHLSEAERMFFVSLLLNQILSWMRSRSGTTSLRTLIYMDEIFGYLPPVAEPPSKKPLLTLLKQARAYGVGVVLATQNPVDLDYKGLSNTGTWFIGRLQTERDKARMLDGLEGISKGSVSFKRRDMDKIISNLGKRVFLLHNVHEKNPMIFHTRWAMSYLRGPLTRTQIKKLMKDKKNQTLSAKGKIQTKPSHDSTNLTSRPMLPSKIPQYFLNESSGSTEYQATLVGIANVHFIDKKTKKKLQTERVGLGFNLQENIIDVNWEEAENLEISERNLKKQEPKEGHYSNIPSIATNPKNYSKWKRELKDYLYRTKGLDYFTSKNFKLSSKPFESERDFRIRLREVARERRDTEIEKLRKKYKRKITTLKERLRKAQQIVEREKEDSKGQKLNTAISIGASLLSAFSGSKNLNLGNIGRAATSARSMGRYGRASGDVRRAKETVVAVTSQLDLINQDLQDGIDRIGERFDPLTEELVVNEIKPRRSDVDLRIVALVWKPVGQY